jgi:chromate transporter
VRSLSRSLGEIAAVFLKLGVIAVGGPAVHVALMRREVVLKRRWLDEKAFLDDFAACQLIPGPSSTELAILLGYRRGGAPGLVAAGVLFILPAMLIMLLLAWVYSRYATSSLVAGALHGVRPVVVGLIIWALIDLGRRIVRGLLLAIVGVAVMVAALLGLNPILLLALGGLALVLRGSFRFKSFAPGFAAASVATNTSLLGIFLVFLKYGAVSFGSGYVLFAFLHTDVVQTYHWLTTQQLVDAIAISQATPGPVFTVATFIGYLVAGSGGALVATVGIFLPGFVLVPFLERIVRLVNAHAWARAFLEGVNVAAVGLIAAVALQLGRAALVDPLSAGIAAVSLAVLLRFPLSAPVLVIAGGVLGVLLMR